MALKTFVKVSGVNNLSDARYCAGMGVDLLGFNVEEDHPNFTSKEKFNEISEWLSGVDFVGEFENTTSKDLLGTISQYNLSTVEIQNYSLIDNLTDFKSILKVEIKDLDRLPFNLSADMLLVKSTNELSPEEVSKIRERTGRIKVLLDCNVTPKNVENLIDQTGAYGIALTAGSEIRPGYKDYDELADILEALEVED